MVWFTKWKMDQLRISATVINCQVKEAMRKENLIKDNLAKADNVLADPIDFRGSDICISGNPSQNKSCRSGDQKLQDNANKV